MVRLQPADFPAASGSGSPTASGIFVIYGLQTPKKPGDLCFANPLSGYTCSEEGGRLLALMIKRHLSATPKRPAMSALAHLLGAWRSGARSVRRSR